MSDQNTDVLSERKEEMRMQLRQAIGLASAMDGSLWSGIALRNDPISMNVPRYGRLAETVIDDILTDMVQLEEEPGREKMALAELESEFSKRFAIKAARSIEAQRDESYKAGTRAPEGFGTMYARGR